MQNQNGIMCKDDTRRLEVINSTLNGIDYIEVEPTNQKKIQIYLLKPISPGSSELEEKLGKIENYEISGGVRIKDIRCKSVSVNDDKKSITIILNTSGDFSPYTLEIKIGLPFLDPIFSKQVFSFKAGCPLHFDCRPEEFSEPEKAEEPPVIDYMAKDYASFRRALIDFISTKYPYWAERSEADLGMALVDLFSYVADRLSYYQDAVANEAYLETARQRVSVKRHACLIDYNIHEGLNARTFLFMKIANGSSGTVPAGTTVLSRLEIPLKLEGATLVPPHDAEIQNSVRSQALSASEAVFKTVEDATLHSTLNEIKIHTWGNEQCCLPRGTASLDLIGDLAFDLNRDGPKGNRQETWRLKEGDFLLLEEIKSPESGERVDADPNHRQVVRLTRVESNSDPMLDPTHLTRVSWDRIDALSFPLWVSTKLENGRKERYISVARGNLVLADHGRTIEEWHPANPESDPKAPGIKKGDTAYTFELKKGPMTFCTMRQKNGIKKPSVQEMFKVNPHEAIADVHIERWEDQQVSPSGERPKWEVWPDLLGSNPFDRHFVVETRNDGRAVIRFGDGKFGMKPPEGSHFKVTYRIGNGPGGNVGAEKLVHIVKRDPNDPAMKDKNWPEILMVRNPLPAWGGTEPETIDQVKLLAPKAFHAELLRTVTEDDYAQMAEKHPEVSKAVATFRWTGSWHTVYVTIDPKGHTELTPDLKEHLRLHLSQYKLAGYDINIDSPAFVPLEIEVRVCINRNHFRAHVKEALLKALSNQELPGGGKGFFHPDNYTFGQAVYLSQLYSALEKVDGVDSVDFVVFKRLGKRENNELERGYIPMGRLEIARLDNDPNFPENGVLRLNMLGGK